MQNAAKFAAFLCLVSGWFWRFINVVW